MNRKKISVYIAIWLCSAVFTVFAAENVLPSENVNGNAVGANDVSATLKNAKNRKIVSANVSGYPGKIGEVESDSKSRTANATGAVVPQYVSFSLTLYGEIAEIGVGDGDGMVELETYSVTRTEKGNYWIELVSGNQSVIPVDNTTAFIAKSNNNPSGENSTWSIKKDGMGANLYTGSSATQITTPVNLEASKYSVEGTAVAEPDQNSGTEIFVIGVLNLISGDVTSPNDSGEVQTLYVPAGKSFTIKANRKPEDTQKWPDEKPTWTLTPDAGNPALPEGVTDLVLPEDANGKDEITLTPNAKIPWGKYTVTAKCASDDSSHVDAEKSIDVAINPVLVYSDTNRDGIINHEDIENRDKWISETENQKGSGAICTPGNPFKDLNDPSKAINAQDSTLQKIVLQKNMTISEDMTLTLTADKPTFFRLYDKDDKIIAVPNGGLAIPVNEINNGDIVYRISTTIRKAGRNNIKLTLMLKKGENKVFSDTLNLRIAPLILSSNMQPIQHEYIYTFADLSCLFWLQDYMELFSAHKDSGESTHIMIDLMHTDKTIYQAVRDILSAIRSGNNNSAYYKRVTSNAAAFYMQSFELANNGDGGDIECTPPLKGKPFGRAILGSKPEVHPKIKEIIKSQGIQTDIISIYTGVLAVGHVDELLSYITDDTVMIASPRRALDLLHAKLVTAATVFGQENLANETILASSNEFNPNDIDGDILIERDAINNIQEIRRFKIKDLLVMSKKDISQNKQFIESKNITIKKQVGGKYLLSNVNNTNLYEAENYIRVGNDYFQIDSITGATSFTAAFIASYKLNENKIVATTAPDYPQPTNIPYIYCTRAIFVESIKAPNRMEFSDMLKSVTDKLGPWESQKTGNKTKFIEIPILFAKKQYR